MLISLLSNLDVWQTHADLVYLQIFTYMAVMAALHLTVSPEHLLLHMALAPWWDLLSEVGTHTYVCMFVVCGRVRRADGCVCK